MKKVIPPLSIIRLNDSVPKRYKKYIGKMFNVGYYSRQDGLDVIWLTDKNGDLVMTINHEELHKYFEIVELSKERSFYGRKI